MAVRKFKPTSPGRRFMTVSDFQEITKSEPEKTLLAPLPKRAGRNVHGRITTRHRGGGHKRRYRLIDFKRRKDGVAGPRALDRVRPQPLGPDRAPALRRRREALHPGAASAARRPDGRVGRERRHPPRQRHAAAIDADRHHGARRRAPAGPGRARWCAPPAARRSSWPRRAARRSCGCRRARCGASPRSAARPSASSGTSPTRSSPAARPGARGGRAAGPTVRGTVMNPVDHPHGGGEGKNKGSHPVTPWGKPTLGFRTRNKKKASSKDIVRARRRGKGRR